MQEEEYALSGWWIAAILTGVVGVFTAPICWILKDGLLGAYPSHGLGALSHFFWCYLWGIWPVLTIALVMKATSSRVTRRVCLGLLCVCAGIFLTDTVYSKVYVGYKSWDTPFMAPAQITLWHQGQSSTYQWTQESVDNEPDKIWQAWEIAHNSTHCLRCFGAAEPFVAGCRLSSVTLLWSEKNVYIMSDRRSGTFTRPRNAEDKRLLDYLFRALSPAHTVTP